LAKWHDAIVVLEIAHLPLKNNWREPGKDRNAFSAHAVVTKDAKF
jgi:hypothetical protein